MVKRIVFGVGLLGFSILCRGAANRDSYFPSGYETSRTTFRELTGEDKFQGSVRGKFVVPSKSDSDLTLDWVHILAQKQDATLFILFSGIHGPESYGGAAVQRLFIEEILPQLDRARTGVLLAHGLNPFGFKNHRRVTENNIDLNRNFGIDSSLFKTRNEKFGNFTEILAPEKPVAGIYFPFARTIFRIGWELVSGRATRAELTEVIESGQFEFPRSILYGGSDFEPQTRFFLDLIKKEARLYPRIVFIDIHTGLGEKGELHIITGAEFKKNDPELIQTLLRSHPDPTSFKLTASDAEGFYPVSGDTVDVPPLLFPDKKVLAFTAEFGTLGKSLPVQLDSLQRIIQENQGFQHGYASPELKKKVEARFLELFYPAQDLEWKTTVLDKANRFLSGVLRPLTMPGESN